MPPPPKKKIFQARIERLYGNEPSVFVRVIDKNDFLAMVRVVKETWGPRAFFDPETRRVMWLNATKMARQFGAEAVALTGKISIEMIEVPHAPKD